MLIKTYRNDGTENAINPKYVAYITKPEGRYEGTIILSCGTSIGYARPANLVDIVSKALQQE